MPPNQVILALALFLTFFVMMPTFREINHDAVEPYLRGDHRAAGGDARAPHAAAGTFMLRQTREKDLALFININGAERPASVADVPADVVIPAFLISELKSAFQISFMVYIPFLVLDMVVAAILTSMGMIAAAAGADLAALQADDLRPGRRLEPARQRARQELPLEDVMTREMVLQIGRNALEITLILAGPVLLFG